MLKVLSLFSGIGAFEKALERLGIQHEVVNYCEIDKYASKAYSLIHNVPESKNLGDISKVNEKTLPDFNLMTYGFPCQDISIAGKQAGIIAGETRSGLLHEALRILEAKKPEYAIAENVKNLLGNKFKLDFARLLKTLDRIGYNSYYAVLNAMEHEVPQRRERVFIVSIRKDIDNVNFSFPEPKELKIKLKDLLEEEVDEKYFIKDSRLKIIEQNLGDVFKDHFIIGSSQKNAYVGDESICPSLTSAMGQGGGQTPMIKELPHQDVSYCIDANYWKGTTVEQFITKKRRQLVQVAVKEATKKGYAMATVGDSINLEQPNSQTRRGRVGREVAQTLTTSCNQATLLSDYRIRKLTPKECWLLMNFDSEDIDKCVAAGISDTQIYKMAGNSIVVKVLEGIFENLLVKSVPMKTDKGEEYRQIALNV